MREPSLFVRPVTTVVVGKITYLADENRPFVSLVVVSIGDTPISTNKDVFDKLSPKIPSIIAVRDSNEFDIKAALSPTENPVGDRSMPHISLLYSFSFSKNEETKAQQVARAKEICGQEVRFTINPEEFKIVTAANALKDKATTVVTSAAYAEAPTLGDTRNTICTIEISATTQEVLRLIGCKILDDPTFKGNTDRSGKVQPYHMSIAQAKFDDEIFKFTLDQPKVAVPNV